MGALVAAVKPIIIWLANSAEVKKLVVELLEGYVKSTDNTVDDLVVETVRKALLGEEKA
jgi:hypothetical protein